MKNLIISIIILPFLTFADFSNYIGTWKGSGKYMNRGISYICSPYYFTLNIQNNILDLYDWNYKCKGNIISPKTRSLEISGNDLIDRNGNIVGEITDEKILIKDQDPAFELFIKRYENDIFVIESIVDDTREEFMIGILK